MKVSGQLYVLAALTPGKNLCLYAVVTDDILRHLIRQRVIKM